jgi:hypothetical protein
MEISLNARQPIVKDSGRWRDEAQAGRAAASHAQRHAMLEKRCAKMEHEMRQAA